jgi:hypothetical protein
MPALTTPMRFRIILRTKSDMRRLAVALAVAECAGAVRECLRFGDLAVTGGGRGPGARRVVNSECEPGLTRLWGEDNVRSII